MKINYRNMIGFKKILLLVFVSLKNSYGQECESNGIRCISCTDYQKCNAGVPEGEIISCTEGNSCTTDAMVECRTKLNCYAAEDCLSEGIFPDPLVESNFYVCLGDPFIGFTKYEFSCQPDYYFDGASYMCVPKAATDPSPTLTVITTEPTQPTQPTEPTETTEETPTTVPTTMAPTTSPTPECLMPGIFPVPNNCKLYYRCSTTLQLYYFTCPGNSYFNENALKCSMIITPSCQEQIMRNATSTIFTSPVTKPALPTEDPSPPVAFICPAIGTYENPVSCKNYFRCSSNGKVYTFTCPGASYFNEITKSCTLILTPRCAKLIQG